MADRVIRLGDQDGETAKSSIKILEGKELATSQIGQGRGWSNAQKISENVTREVFGELTQGQAPGPGEARDAGGPVQEVAIVADSPGADEGVRLMLGQLEIEPAPWPELRARLLANGGASSGSAAVVLAIETESPPESWLFDAGLARGALGPRAVFAQFGGGPIPAQLTGVDVMRLEPSDQA